MVLVPVALVTATDAAPAVPPGVVAVICVSLTTVTLVAGPPPTVTPVVPMKLDPLIVIGVPPATGPWLGDTPVTIGTGPRTVRLTVAGAEVTLPGPLPLVAVKAKLSAPLNPDAGV